MSRANLEKRAFDLFDQVCDLPEDARSAFLAAHCAEPELRAEVEALLRVDGNRGSFLDDTGSGSALDAIAAQAFGNDGGIPDQIGPYQVIRKIAEGGMGIIYEAQQESPRRRVALKVLQAGVMNREMLRRFQQEAQVLGQLQHPSIAQIYEAGLTDATPEQRPFFAMELIGGQPLDVHAREQQLSIQQRLELMARVCDALQHAHQKGIIHRDLKPANVLVMSQATTMDAKTGSVTVVDGIGLPKVLDFGIARMTDRDAQHTTLQTEVGQLVGTLAYMSPEQLLGNSTDLDTRVDVYALGVMLYELLADRRPHDLTGLSMAEAARRIQEVEPVRLGALRRELRGDIETIVAKALDKDRERRYDSAAALAADLRRTLAHQPIDARPASAFYQLAKFARRNKGLMAGAVVAVAALTIGLAVATLGLARALQAKEEVDLVANFHGGIIKSVNLEEMGRVILDEVAEQQERAAAAGNSTSVNPATLARAVVDKSLLSKASAAAEAQFADMPAIQADLHESLHETYFALALYDQALVEAQRTLELRRAQLGNDHTDTVKTIGNVCLVLNNLGRFEEAEPYCREALERRQAALSDDAPLVIEAKLRAARNLIRLQRPEGEQLLVETHAVAQRVLPRDDWRLVELRLAMSRVHHRKGRFSDALELQRKVHESYVRVRGPDHPLTLGAESFIATSLDRLGQLDEALVLRCDLLERAERVLGEDDPRTLRVLFSVARSYNLLGDIDRTRATCETLLERQRRTLGPDHPATVNTIAQLKKLQASSR